MAAFLSSSAFSLSFSESSSFFNFKRRLSSSSDSEKSPSRAKLVAFSFGLEFDLPTLNIFVFLDFVFFLSELTSSSMPF
jgi:hypothetical protein